jgi:biotin carboxylase
LIQRSLGSAENFKLEYARSPLMHAATAEGIRAPRTEVVENLDDLQQMVEQMGLPLVLKANGTSGGSGVKIVNNIEEAERAWLKLQAVPSLLKAAKRVIVDKDLTLALPALLRRRPVVNAQAHIAGYEATSAVACWQGAVLAALHFEVVYKRDSTGPATVVRMVENAEMSAAAEKIVRRLNLSGLHGFDYMIESQTGDAYLIEMNPRATQVGHLALGPGRDIPGALHAILTGQPLQVTPKVTEQSMIALFPQEWIRDAASPFLTSAYHDVPWDEPELVRDCANSRRKQSEWYSQPALRPARSSTIPTVPVPAPAKMRVE